MLVLTRKSGQKIIIGDNIEIVIIKVSGDQVSVGIEAPRTLSIYREELIREIEKENMGGVLNRKNVSMQSIAKDLKFKKKIKTEDCKKSKS
jgi:carbon storage regulator